MQTPEKPGSVALKGSQSPATTGHAQSPTLGAHSPGLGGHVRNSSLGRKDGLGEEAATFEDRRKENFEAGRLELERRRRAIKEQQERAMVSKGGGVGEQKLTSTNLHSSGVQELVS